MPNDITASTERTSLLPEVSFPIYNPDTDALEHIKGKYLSSGSGGSAVPVTGGLYFDGYANTAPVAHLLTGANILGTPFSMSATIVVPPKSFIKATGRGIVGVSASNPTSTLNCSITIGIRGTTGYGNTGVIAATCGTTNASTAVTTATLGLLVGQSVYGTGIPTGATITAVNAGVGFTLSVAATATNASNALTFSPISTAGDLIIKAIGSSGSDLDMVVPGFCDAYAGQTVRIDFTRGLTAVDFPAKVYINRVLAVSTSGSGTDWGCSMGSNPYFFYGAQSSARPWVGKIIQAGLGVLEYLADDIFGFNLPSSPQLGSVVWGSIINNRDQDCNAYSGFTWNDWTQDGVAYTESGGGTVTPTAGSANSWAHGEVNGTTAPGKLRLTAKASSGKNIATKGGAIRGRAYRITIKARCVSGTEVPLYIGFGHNVSDTSQDTNIGEALVITPTGTELTYTARVVARRSSTFSIALVNDADSAGQVFEFDMITVERDGWAVWTNMDYGDSFAVPNISNPDSDGIIPASSAIAWDSPRRNVASCVTLAADQAVASSTTLVDTGLTFRVAANATYSFDITARFTLAGTASGLKYNLVAPSGAVGAATVIVFNTVLNNLNEAQDATSFPVLVQGSMGSAGTHQLRIQGVIENGATEGLVTLQMAQFVSDAGAITLKKYSTAVFTRRK